MNLFYTADLTATEIILPEEESRHIRKVLRLKDGDMLHLTDGKGLLAEAVIIDSRERSCKLQVSGLTITRPSRQSRLHIGIAPTKSTDRFEWFIEKATEIGIEEVTPIICTHSEKSSLRTERLRKIMMSAMKQSLRQFLPILNETEDFGDFILKPRTGQRFIAYCPSGNEALLWQIMKGNEDVTILIGPEGDFSSREVELAVRQGYTPVSLGKERLRTETAGVMVCGVMKIVNNE